MQRASQKEEIRVVATEEGDPRSYKRKEDSSFQEDDSSEEEAQRRLDQELQSAEGRGYTAKGQLKGERMSGSIVDDMH